MMRLYRLVSVMALLGMMLVACTSAPERESQDPRKAAELNAELGLNYMVQGNHEAAMEKLLRAVEYDSRSVNGHHYLAELYRRLERKEQAMEHFERAADLAPRDAAIQNNFGVFLCSEREFDLGEKRFLQALENPVWSGRDQAYENLGQCMQDKGDKVKAEKYYRDALKINPRLPKALLAMVDISMQQRNHISARAFLQRYAAVAPHTPHSLWMGIQIERVLGDRNALASYGMSLRNNFPAAEETQLYLKSR